MHWAVGDLSVAPPESCGHLLHDLPCTAAPSWPFSNEAWKACVKLPWDVWGRGLLWDRDTSNSSGLSHLGNTVLTALGPVLRTAG